MDDFGSTLCPVQNLCFINIIFKWSRVFHYVDCAIVHIIIIYTEHFIYKYKIHNDLHRITFKKYNDEAKSFACA